ncbi:MAG: hypothetical protein V4603_08155 [Pseudomonadota bacterium]
MRFLKWFSIVASTLLLAGCVSSLLVGNQMQSKLMWAFLTPLVGFNPNDINFFEAPIIKDRMTALLGDKYEPTMKLLHTANEIQHEGALYYVMSRYAPAVVSSVVPADVQSEVQAIVDTAGLVWNSDTNQLAVMLVKDGAPELIAEQAKAAVVEALVPALPAEMQAVYDKAMAAKAAVDAQKQQLEDLKLQVTDPDDPLLELIREKTGNN